MRDNAPLRRRTQFGVAKRTKKKDCTWTVSLIRKRGEFLGTVEAPDREAAEAAAVVRFNLSEVQRGRLVVQETA
jgi:hypothetical protein